MRDNCTFKNRYRSAFNVDEYEFDKFDGDDLVSPALDLLLLLLLLLLFLVRPGGERGRGRDQALAFGVLDVDGRLIVRLYLYCNTYSSSNRW